MHQEILLKTHMVIQAHNHPQSEELGENDYMFRASLSYIARPQRGRKGRREKERGREKEGALLHGLLTNPLAHPTHFHNA